MICRKKEKKGKEENHENMDCGKFCMYGLSFLWKDVMRHEEGEEEEGEEE